MANLRAADDLIGPAVAETIAALDPNQVDRGAVQLAKHYAAALDASHCSECDTDTSLDTLGPKLLAALDALLATPAARSRMRKGGAAGAGGNRLQALREARGA